MQTIKYIYWQEDDAWLGYLLDYPDYWTQGESFDDLLDHLRDLQTDIAGGHATRNIDPLADPARYRWPAAVAARLQSLLDRHEAGQTLSAEERAEAEGLADLNDLLTLLRIRAEQGRLARPLVAASPSEEITEDEAILVAIRLGETAADAGRTFTHDEVKEWSKSWTGKSSAQKTAEGDSTHFRDG